MYCFGLIKIDNIEKIIRVDITNCDKGLIKGSIMNKHHLFSRQESKLKKSKNSHKYFIVGTLATLLAACGNKSQTPDEKLYDKLIDLATNANITVTDGNATVTLNKKGGIVVIADGDNVVTGGKGDDTITTGKGDDQVDGGAGADKIITGDGVDIVRAGAGADDVNTGAGHDIIVVIGINENGNTYTQSAIDNATGNVNLSSLITLDDINNFGVVGAVSDVIAGDIIDGGADGATLVVYGEVDLTGVSLSNITIIEVHSKLIISVEKLNELIANGKFEGILGDDKSIIQIVNDSNDPNAKVDLSGIDINNVKKLELDSNIEVKIDQDNIDGLKEISGNQGVKITVEKEEGAPQQEVDLADLKLTGVDKLELGADVKVTLSKQTVDGLKEIGTQNSGDKVEIKLEVKDGEEEIDLAKLKLDNIEKLELGKNVKVTLNQDNIDGLKEVAAESAGDEVEITLEKTAGESEVDLTGLNIKDVDKLKVGDGVDLKVDKGALDGLAEIRKEDSSGEDFSIEIERDEDQQGEVDLSKLDISGVDKLKVAEDVVVVIEQDLIDELEEVSGDGAVQSDEEGETLDLGDGGSIQVATDNGGGNTSYANVASVAENTSTVNYGTLNGVDVSAATFALSGSDAALFTVNANGEVTFNSEPNFEAPADTANGGATAQDNVYEITLDVTENSTTTTHNIVINVTDANDAPAFTFSGLTESDVQENSGSTALDVVVATDQDQDDVITYSLSGDDAEFFTIDATTSAVSFIGGLDFEAPADENSDNVYEVSVVATDLAGASTSRDIEITVVDVNEAPTFEDDGAAILITEENQTTAGNVGATDPENDTITYSLSGTDAGLFTVNSTGDIIFITAPDFEQPDDNNQDGIYNLTITADDGEGHTTDRVVTIATTNQNEAPEFSSDDILNVNLAEGLTTFAADTATDVDADDLTYSLTGADASSFEINTTTGAVNFTNAPNFEAPEDQGTNNVYDINIVATDGGGLSDSRAIKITITDTNEAPSFSSDAQLVVSVGQYQTGSAPVAFVTATDVDDGDTIDYTLGGTDASLFEISANGAISFKTANPFITGGDNVYDVVAFATDSDGLTDMRDVQITVTDQNTAPSFGSPPTEVDVSENSTEVGNFGATDFDGDNITYDLVGDDKALFNISSSGVVTFADAPDYENPENANHTYNFTITADDGTQSTNHSVTVTVQNKAETPDVYVSAYSPNEDGQQSLRDSGEYQTRSTALSNDNSVVTFTSWHQEHQQDHVWAQLLDSSGDKIGDAIQISGDDNPDNHSLRSEVTALDNGGFVVIWSISIDGENGEDDTGSYYARLYDSTGSSTSSEIEILTTDFKDNRNPYVEMTSDGNLIFVMTKKTVDLNGNDTNTIIAKTYDIANDNLGDEFVLPNFTYNNDDQAYEHIEDIVALDNGEILIVFGSDNRASIQKLSISDGVISTSGDRINVSNDDQNNGQWIKAAQLDNGDYVVTWLLDLTDKSIDRDDPDFKEIQEIKYQVFSADGTAVSEILNVDPADDAFILGPQITAINGGGFAIVFVTERIGQEGKLLQIQEYSANGTAIGNSVIINSDTDLNVSSLYPTSLSVLDGDKLLVSWFGRHEVDYNEGHYQVINFHTDSSFVYEFDANAISPFPTDAMADNPDDETLEMTLTEVPLGIYFFNPNNGSSTPVGTYTPDGNGVTQTVTIAGGDITDLHIFNPSGDSTFTLTISVVATASNGTTASKDFSLNFNVTDYGSAPVIDMPEILNTAENHTVVAQIEFTDVDTADSHVFELTGEDAYQFEVSATGLISFKESPDADVIDDHEFRFNIIVTDNKGNSDQQEVRVRLANTDEAPTIDTSINSFTVQEGDNENFAHINLLGHSHARFSLKGADAGLFKIDRNDGDLKFAVRPDFENPQDDDHDNSYDVTIVATDEYRGLSSEFDVTVNVTDNTNELDFDAPTLTTPTFNQVLDAPIANVADVYEFGGNMATLSDGRIVTVWSEEDVADGSQDIPDRVYYKIYAPDGSVLTARTAIGVASGDLNQLSPRVIAGANGDFFVAIHHGDEQSGNAQFVGTQFTASGDSHTGSGGFIDLSVGNLYTSELYSGVMDIAQLSNGNFVISYQTNYHNVTVNTVSSTGTIISTVEVAHDLDSNENTTNERTSIVEVLDDGSGFVVAWMRRDNDGDEQVIMVERYDNNGAVVAGSQNELSLDVDQGDRIENKDPDVVALGGDKYAVVWETVLGDHQPKAIMLQMMDANGTVGSIVRISTSDESGADPKAIKLLGSEGGLLVVWSENGGINGQQFATDGTKIGDNFAIANQPISSEAESIEVTALQDGGFAVKWGETRPTDNPDNDNGGNDGDTYIQIYNFSTTTTWNHNDWQTIPVPIDYLSDSANIDHIELTVLGAPDDAQFEIRDREDHDDHAHRNHRDGEPWVFEESDIANLNIRFGNNFEGSVTLTYVFTAVGADGSSVASSSIVVPYDIIDVNSAPHYHDDFQDRYLELFEGETVLTSEGNVIIKEGFDHDGDSFSMSIEGPDGHLFGVGADGSIFFKAAPDFESSEAANQGEPDIYKFVLVITDEHGAENRRDYEVRVKDRGGDENFSGLTLTGTPNSGNDGDFIDLNLTLSDAPTNSHINDITIFGTEGYVFNAGQSHGNGSWTVAADAISTLQVKSIYNANSAHTFHFEVRYIDENSGGATKLHQAVEVTFTNIENAPVFEVDSSTFHVNELDLFIKGLKASDKDGDNLNFTLSGDDADVFNYDGATGNISFKDGFEPGNADAGTQYHLTVTASDGNGATGDTAQDFTIIVDPTPATQVNANFINDLASLNKQQLTFSEDENNQQRSPNAVILDSGSGILVWEQDNKILAQKYNPFLTGAIGDITEIIEDGYNPKVVVTPNGQAILTWQENDGDNDGIYTAFVNQNGVNGPTLGTKMRINEDISGASRDPEVVILADTNSAVFIWQQDDNGDRNIMGRHTTLNFNNEIVGNSFQVNSHQEGAQTDYKITSLDNGTIVVTWTSFGGQDGDGAGIYMQQFGPNQSGNFVALLNGGEDVLVNGNTLGDQLDAEVAAVNGGFAVTWRDSFNWGDVHVKIYDENGNPISSDADFIVSDTYEDHSEWRPSILDIGNGQFLVTWVQNRRDDDTDTSYETLVGQRFDSEGKKYGEEFTIDEFERGSGDEWFGDVEINAFLTSSISGFTISWVHGVRENDTEVEHIFSREFVQLNTVKLEKLDTMKFPVSSDVDDSYQLSVTISGLPSNDKLEVSVYDADTDTYSLVTAQSNGDYILTKAQYENLHLTATSESSATKTVSVNIIATAPNGETSSISSEFALVVGVKANVDSSHEFIDQNQIDIVTGTDQIDTFVVVGNKDDFKLLWSGDDIGLVDIGETRLDLLHGIELIRFDDGTFTLEQLDIFDIDNLVIPDGEQLSSVFKLIDYDPLDLFLF